MIIISAVADQIIEIRNAISSVFGWMTDLKRFPEKWVNPVKDLFKKANSHANQL